MTIRTVRGFGYVMELMPCRAIAACVASLARLAPLRWIWLFGLTAAAAGAYWLATASANIAFDRGLQDEALGPGLAKIVWTDRGPLLDVSRQALELLTWDNAERNAFVVVDENGRAIAGDAGVPLPDRRDNSFAKPQVLTPNSRARRCAARFFCSARRCWTAASIVVVETWHRLPAPAARRGAGDGHAHTGDCLAHHRPAGLGHPPWPGAAARDRQRGGAVRPLTCERSPVAGVPAEVVPMIERINFLLADAAVRESAAALCGRCCPSVAHARGRAARADPGAGAGVAVDAHLAPLVQALSSSGERLSRLIGQLLSLVRTEVRWA